MKVKIDGERCTGHGRCYALSPDVFEPDDEGFNAARGTILDIPSGQEEAAMVGVSNCPEQAMTIVD